MSHSAKSRRRGLRLTVEAREVLEAALVARWRSDPSYGKLTRQLRADLLDVSLATANRMLAGEGVDESTLTTAFRRVGLPWRESYVQSAPQPVPFPVSDPIAPDPAPAASPAKPADGPEARSPMRASVALAAVFLVAAVCCGIFLIGRAKAPNLNWKGEANDAFIEGLALYHRADYPGAAAKAQIAFEIAQAHNDAGDMSAALRLKADLLAVQGRLDEAMEIYRRALELRTLFGRDPHRAPLLQAMGDVETRRGQYGSAQKYLLESRNGYLRYRETVGAAMTARDLGSVALGVRDLRAADHWFRVALVEVARQDEPALVIDIESRQALLALARERPEEALTLLLRSERYWVANGHARWIALTRLQLAQTEIRLRRPERARAYLQDSLRGFQSIGDRPRVQEAHRLLDALSDHRHALQLQP